MDNIGNTKNEGGLSLEGMSPFLNKDIDKERIYIYQSIGSTNVKAKEMARLPQTKDMTVVMADTQSAGRGTKGRSFFSPFGGIYVSFIFKPKNLWVNVSQSFIMLSAVAACEAIEEVTGKRPGIKWVNDIMLGGRKIGGILTECSLTPEGDRVDWVVSGIGLNYCFANEKLPPDIKTKAGAIYEPCEVKASRDELAAVLINKMNEAAINPDFEDVQHKYFSRLISVQT